PAVCSGPRRPALLDDSAAADRHARQTDRRRELLRGAQSEVAEMKWPLPGPTKGCGQRSRNLEREEARANAPGYCLGAGAHAELCEHRGRMVCHCVRGEIELRRNFLVAQPLRDKAQHIQLARREGDAFLGQSRRCRGRDRPLAHHHIGLLGFVHEHDLRIDLDERREPAPRDRIGHVEVDAQLHVSPESRRSTSGAGTASATPDTTIAATPITRPCASASGPPEFPGARRTSAWIQTNEPFPFSPYPRGNGLTAWSTPTVTASLTPNG